MATPQQIINDLIQDEDFLSLSEQEQDQITQEMISKHASKSLSNFEQSVIRTESMIAERPSVLRDLGERFQEEGVIGAFKNRPFMTPLQAFGAGSEVMFGLPSSAGLAIQRGEEDQIGNDLMSVMTGNRPTRAADIVRTALPDFPGRDVAAEVTGFIGEAFDPRQLAAGATKLVSTLGKEMPQKAATMIGRKSMEIQTGLRNFNTKIFNEYGDRLANLGKDVPEKIGINANEVISRIGKILREESIIDGTGKQIMANEALSAKQQRMVGLFNNYFDRAKEKIPAKELVAQAQKLRDMLPKSKKALRGSADHLVADIRAAIIEPLEDVLPGFKDLNTWYRKEKDFTRAVHSLFPAYGSPFELKSGAKWLTGYNSMTEFDQMLLKSIQKKLKIGGLESSAKRAAGMKQISSGIANLPIIGSARRIAGGGSQVLGSFLEQPIIAPNMGLPAPVSFALPALAAGARSALPQFNGNNDQTP